MYVSESEILKVQKYENEIVNDTMCVNLLCSCIHKVWIAVNAGWTKARSSPATRSPDNHHHQYHFGKITCLKPQPYPSQKTTMRQKPQESIV